jgi:hypothetical protein
VITLALRLAHMSDASGSLTQLIVMTLVSGVMIKVFWRESCALLKADPKPKKEYVDEVKEELTAQRSHDAQIIPFVRKTKI